MATATTTQRKAASTQRSTTAKKAAATRRRNAARRSAAAKRAAQTRALNTRTPVQQVQETAEKAVLIPVGAVLVARDNVVETVSGLVDTYSNRQTAQRELSKNLRRFERRGATARTRLERRAKRTRTRVERELRQRRNRAERTLRLNRTRVRREVKGTRRDVTSRVDLVSAQVENVIQTGVTAGTKAVARGQEAIGIA